MLRPILSLGVWLVIVLLLSSIALLYFDHQYWSRTYLRMALLSFSYTTTLPSTFSNFSSFTCSLTSVVGLIKNWQIPMIMSACCDGAGLKSTSMDVDSCASHPRRIYNLILVEASNFLFKLANLVVLFLPN